MMKTLLSLRWVIRMFAAAAATGAVYAPEGMVRNLSALLSTALAALSIDLPAKRNPKGGERHNPAFPGPGETLPVFAAIVLTFTVAACGTVGTGTPAAQVEICPSAVNLAKRITGTGELKVIGVVQLSPNLADCHEMIHAEQHKAEGARAWTDAYISQSVTRGYIGNRYEMAARAACE